MSVLAGGPVVGCRLPSSRGYFSAAEILPGSCRHDVGSEVLGGRGVVEPPLPASCCSPTTTPLLSTEQLPTQPCSIHLPPLVIVNYPLVTDTNKKAYFAGTSENGMVALHNVVVVE